MSENSGWNEYSKYIIITLEKFDKELDKITKDTTDIRAEMANQLTKLKYELHNKMEKCSKEKTESFYGVIKELNELIEKLSIRTVILEKKDLNKIVDATLDKRFITFNEKIIYPLRIKTTIICLIAGIIGGLLFNVVPFVFRFVSSGRF